MCCYATNCRCPNRFSRRTGEIVPKIPYKICPYTPASLLPRNFWERPLPTPDCICSTPLNKPQQPKKNTIVPYTDDKKARVSKVSYGETGGLYPTPNGQNSALYKPESWDERLTSELLKCRAAINLVATRGEKHKTALPNFSNKVERMLAAYHLTDNFPVVDPSIATDAAVKYFYLSPDKNAKHKGIDYEAWDVRMVQAYGPFFNVGGGDVPRGSTYVLFYSAKRKQKPAK